MAGAPAPQAPAASSEKPYDDTPFDAGVQADENSDPKKYIEQLTGKLGQSLRKYTETQGQPDLELEKFAVNSLLSATHTAEMDEDDKNDIIKKVNTSGAKDEAQAQPSPEANTAPPTDNSPEKGAMPQDDAKVPEEPINEMVLDEMSLNDVYAKKLIQLYDSGDERMRRILTSWVSYSNVENRVEFLRDLTETGYEDIQEILQKLKTDFYPNLQIDETSLFLGKPKKNNMFQPGSNDILDKNKLKESFGKNQKNGNFVFKNTIKTILRESLNQDDMTQPETKPQTKPKTAPVKPAEPSRRDKPFRPNVTPGIKVQPKAVKEVRTKKAEYETYHKSFSSAVQAAEMYAISKGYELNEDDWSRQIAFGPAKPKDGMTNRYSIELLKSGVPQKKMLHIQIHGMAFGNDGFTYELNCYIA